MTTELLIARLLQEGIVPGTDLKPCTPGEIQRLEEPAGRPLPREYRQFLASCGNGAGRLFVGTDIFYSAIQGLKKDAGALLVENNEPFGLPTDAFVFSMHQGYAFSYFLFSEGDDPPVHQYVEGNHPALSIPFATFTQFLEMSLFQ